MLLKMAIEYNPKWSTHTATKNVTTPVLVFKQQDFLSSVPRMSVVQTCKRKVVVADWIRLQAEDTREEEVQLVTETLETQLEHNSRLAAAGLTEPPNVITKGTFGK